MPPRRNYGTATYSAGASENPAAEGSVRPSPCAETLSRYPILPPPRNRLDERLALRRSFSHSEADSFMTIGWRSMSPQRDDLAPTEAMPPAPSRGHDRFLPGAVLGNRYRIVALAGRGGMGEVYRADDLKIGQPVALKFLSADLERDPDRLKRLMGEVRIARQVSHPNVCRVYDVGEFQGHHFITMEYIDGEDLAALLRRIGRLPQEKALDLTRQIAAGLAAAHVQGIVHRDLKPANVMLDSRGRARITDFGLAAAAEAVHGKEARSGTPAYMAPEQVAGGAITPRTDVYALGLVLYEMFTGKRPFDGSTKPGSGSRPASE